MNESDTNLVSKIDAKYDSKKKRRVSGGLDKEAKEAMKNVESKIDDIRKQSMNEINRLEAMMETEANDKKLMFNSFEDSVNSQLSEMVNSNNCL